jgi:Mannosyltransferase (PIG-V)
MHGVSPARPSPSAAPAVVDIVAAICIVAGNTLTGRILPPTWPVAGLSLALLTGIGLLILRCIIWPSPSLFRTWWPRVVAAPGATGRVLVVAAATRVAVLAAGLIVVLLYSHRLADTPRISTDAVVSLPARFDAFWYLDVARHGYHPPPGQDGPLQNIAFFPAYPIAMRIAGDLLTIPASLLHAPDWLGSGDGRVVWGGVLVSLLCFPLALLRVHRLASEDTHDPGAADRACLLLAAYPFALFFSAPYSESLALLALVSLVLAWKRQEQGGGALWGVLFGLCRSNGWCVALALALDRLLRPAPRTAWSRAWMVIAAAPLGAALYSAYVYHLTGDPFAWASAQHAWGFRFQPLSFLVRRSHIVRDIGLRAFWRRDPADIVGFIAALVIAAAGVWLLARREWLYGGIVLAYLAPAVAIDLQAIGRMTSLLFPVFIVLGERVKGARFAALAVVFLGVQMWFACRFFLWQSPY